MPENKSNIFRCYDVDEGPESARCVCIPAFAAEVVKAWCANNEIRVEQLEEFPVVCDAASFRRVFFRNTDGTMLPEQT